MGILFTRVSLGFEILEAHAPHRLGRAEHTTCRTHLTSPPPDCFLTVMVSDAPNLTMY